MKEKLEKGVDRPEWVCFHKWGSWWEDEKGKPYYFRSCEKCGKYDEAIKRFKLDVNKLPNHEDPTESKLDELIKDKKSFTVIGLADKFIKTVGLIENIIEKSGKTCRILTLHTTSVNAAATLLTSIGLVGFTVQVAHNIATMNPDFEVVKDVINNKVIVVYCDHYKPITWW